MIDAADATAKPISQGHPNQAKSSPMPSERARRSQYKQASEPPFQQGHGMLLPGGDAEMPRLERRRARHAKRHDVAIKSEKREKKVEGLSDASCESSDSSLPLTTTKSFFRH